MGVLNHLYEEADEIFSQSQMIIINTVRLVQLLRKSSFPKENIYHMYNPRQFFIWEMLSI